MPGELMAVKRLITNRGRIITCWQEEGRLRKLRMRSIFV